jgi:hypothetical protein
MKKNLKTLWLYLAKRDKKGIQILANFLSRDLSPIRLDDIKRLTLPLSWESKILEYIQQNRIDWEPWVQTEEEFDDLKKNLKARGYSDIPSNGQPMISVTPQLVVNINNFPKEKSMIKKASN